MSVKLTKKQIASAKAATSPAVTKQDKSTSAKKKGYDKLPSCTGCGILISDETSALMCDKCQALVAWKCCACMNLPTEVYDVLVGANCPSLLYLCDDCENSVMKTQDATAEMQKKVQAMLQDMKDTMSYIAANDQQEDFKKMLESNKVYLRKLKALTRL